MKARPTKPAKTVVYRSPQDQLERIDAHIAAATAAMKKLKRLATVALVGGLGLTVGAMVLIWALTDLIVLWALPGVLVGGGLSAVAYFASAAGGDHLRKLHSERRAVEKQLTGQPYGQAKPEIP
jgi:hypothetical protein